MNQDRLSHLNPKAATNIIAERQSLYLRFLHSPYAPLITHMSLLALILSEFALILWSPLWAAILPCLLIHHRIGIMLHEYMHGIPFRRYKHNLLMFSTVNGLLMTFGLLEVFRGNHLAHHRWLNTEKDPGFWNTEGAETERPAIPLSLLVGQLLRGDHGPLLYIKLLYESVAGHHPYVRPNRVLIEAAMSVFWIGFWALIGLPRVPLMLAALHVGIVPPTAFRGAIEHTSYRGDTNFANEYKVKISLFKMNRHIHHHLDPKCPWYLLEFCTPEPLSSINYWMHWYRTFIRRDYVFMQPMKKSLNKASEY
jgi:fatty acid desaturase